LYSFIFIEKAVCFEAITAFSYINIGIFLRIGCFFKGKPAFIFNQKTFLKDYSSKLQNVITDTFDPSKLASLARKSGFLQRKAKLKPEEFVQALMFSDLDHNQLSLQDCCNDLAIHHKKSLSKVGLHKRFNENSVAFLKLVLANQIASRLANDEVPKSNSFSKVVIQDSCKFSLPKCYKDDYPGFGNFAPSIMNIQYSYDLKEGQWESLELTKAIENDQSHSNKRTGDINENELHIRDLGYITTTYLAAVNKANAFFLNRLSSQWQPVQCSNGQRIDWMACYEKLKGTGGCFETTVLIGQGKDTATCRLVAIAVPEEVWAERIRKKQLHAKTMQVGVSDEFKSRCRFNIFITNTESKDLTTSDIIQLYRLRWQIELIFKTWKSLFGIHKVKPVKKERLICQILAKFIWILLNWKIFNCFDQFIKKSSCDYACSLWKFAKQARHHSQSVRNIIAGNISFKKWCKIFINPIINSLFVEDKKGRKSAYTIVNDVFNP